jgi:hypothetical protein
VYDLAVQDLDRHAVWEFALDEEGVEGQDEATVRPFEVAGPLDPGDGMFIVRARFRLSDGTRMRGYLTPQVQGDSSLGTLQPTIVAAGGQVFFWCGMLEPEPSQIAANYARLGKVSAHEVFPIRFESDVELSSGPVTGDLPGFLVLDDFETMQTRVVR